MVIEQHQSKNGYPFVKLPTEDGNKLGRYVHLLVAEAFVPKIPGKWQVDHSDGNPLNNRADNLIRATPKENRDNPIRLARLREKLGHGVIQMDGNGQVINTYETIQQAADATGISRTCISNCCRGNQKSAGSYFWQYSNNNQGVINNEG